MTPDELAAIREPRPHDDDPDNCSECERQERVLNADQSEDWVADFWAWSQPHPPREPKP